MSHQKKTSAQSTTDQATSDQSWWLKKYLSKVYSVRKPQRLGLLLALMLILIFLPQFPTQAQPVTWQWVQSDTHTHAAVSSEALIDLGIMSQATNFGYEALFLSDHNGGSSFHISNQSANHMTFDESYTRWPVGSFGNPINPVNELVSSYVNTGEKSLHLKSTANAEYGETYIWSKRGANRLSGDIILQVSIYPTQVDADSGLYVSASFGGDPTVERETYGYTTEAGVISPGKSTVLVWQLGNARSPSSDPNERVLVYPLSYTLDTWNHYTINVSDAIDDIPAADLPLAYNGLVHLKMAAGATNGTAEAYFDTYIMEPSLPQEAADEFVNRTDFVDDFNTSTFKIFPSYEMGQQRHTNRFNFGITDPADYRSYLYGTDGIPETHDLGYPTQLNHPDTTVSIQEVLDNLAYGADFLEVREDDWLGVWDDLLNEGISILGTWTSDAHSGLSEGKAATQIYSPGLDFDSLMRSLYEGRSYMARNHFHGITILNLDSSSSEPYPARYPIYHSDAQSSADVHLLVSEDINEGYTVTWIRNGEVLDIVTPPDSSYEETRSIPLGAQPWTYVRAEVRRSKGSLRAATQPLFFVAVPDLPVDKQFYIDSITTANGRDYNRLKSKGITSTSWGSINKLLYIGLENPTNALVDLRLTTDEAPQRIKLDGIELSEVSVLAEFEAATSSLWYYDSANQLLYLKALHASEQADLLLEFAMTGDNIPPSKPTNLTATAVHLGRIDLDWDDSTDNLFVSGYNVYRDDEFLTTVVTSNYSDTTVTPENTFSYRVSAFDLAGNTSPLSGVVLATTPATSIFNYTASADTYVDASNENQNYGTSSALRVDADPERNAYLRFDVEGMGGLVANATLWLYANNSTPIGVKVHEISDNSWLEYEMNYVNAVPLGDEIARSGEFNAESWVPFDVTSAVSGNGVVSFGISTDSNASISFASLDSGLNAPKLVIEANTSGPPGPIVITEPITLSVYADAYVRAPLPDNNYGSSSSIRLDGDPEQNGYLRFDLTPYTGTVSVATLRLFANSGSTIGYDVHRVSDNNWEELSITYNNAPSFVSIANSSGSFSAGTWTEVDVTSLITTGEEVSFALSTSSSSSMNLSSREGSNPPELIIEGDNLRQISAIRPAPPFGPPMLDELLYLPLIER